MREVKPHPRLQQSVKHITAKHNIIQIAAGEGSQIQQTLHEETAILDKASAESHYSFSEFSIFYIGLHTICNLGLKDFLLNALIVPSKTGSQHF